MSWFTFRWRKLFLFIRDLGGNVKVDIYVLCYNSKNINC